MYLIDLVGGTEGLLDEGDTDTSYLVMVYRVGDVLSSTRVVDETMICSIWISGTVCAVDNNVVHLDCLRRDLV